MKGVEEEDVVRPELYLILDDKTFYRCRASARILKMFELDWIQFQKVKMDARTAIVDALLEDRDTRRSPMLTYFNEPMNEYLAKRGITIQSDILHSLKDEVS